MTTFNSRIFFCQINGTRQQYFSRNEGRRFFPGVRGKHPGDSYFWTANSPLCYSRGKMILPKWFCWLTVVTQQCLFSYEGMGLTFCGGYRFIASDNY